MTSKKDNNDTKQPSELPGMMLVAAIAFLVIYGACDLADWVMGVVGIIGSQSAS